MTESEEAARVADLPKRVWNWVVANLPLLTVGGIFCTSMFLIAVFGEWGLSGIQLVTPQDVVFPGFGMGYLVFTIIVLPFMLAHVGSWFSTKGAVGLILHRFSWLLLTVSAAWLVFPPSTQWRYFAAFLFSSSGILLLKQAKKSPPLSFWAKCRMWAMAVFVAISLTIWFFGTAGALFNQVVRAGFAKGLYVTDKDAPCMGKVLWWGERAIVIRCSVGSEEIRVMPPKDDLKFNTEREFALASKYIAQ